MEINSVFLIILILLVIAVLFYIKGSFEIMKNISSFEKEVLDSAQKMMKKVQKGLMLNHKIKNNALPVDYEKETQEFEQFLESKKMKSINQLKEDIYYG